MWRYINEMIGRAQVESEKIYELNGPNSIDHKSSDITNMLIDFFSTAGKILHNKSAPTDRIAYRNYLQNANSENHRFKFSTVTSDQIILLISTSNDIGPGYDKIPMFVYKENSTYLSPIISHICNKSLISGLFLSELTLGKVTCLFKAVITNIQEIVAQ